MSCLDIVISISEVDNSPPVQFQEQGRSLLEETAEEFSGSWSSAINYSGRQRMYSQKMAKEVAFIKLGVDVDHYLWALSDTRQKFAFVNDGLFTGNKALGLPSAPNDEFETQMGVINDIWGPFVGAIDIILENGYVNTTEMDTVVNYNSPLLTELNNLVLMYEAIASAEGGSGTSAEINSAINLAGKQRMLSQKMVKEYLFVLCEYDAQDNIGAVQSTATLFDQILTGMQYGDAELNLLPAPNDEILFWIARVNELWGGESGLKAIMLKEPSHYKITNVASANIPILGRSNVVVGLYEQIGNTPPPPPAEPPSPMAPPSEAHRIQHTIALTLATYATLSTAFAS